MRKTYNLITTALCVIFTLATTATAQAATVTIPADYQPPDDAGGLQIVELLPHSPSCSPTATDPLCGDYVKLFNDGDEPVNLADYRLRTSYGGLNSSSRNTFSLDGSLDPGEYLLINTKDDGSPLSLTDSGGYVWLEDALGVQAYDPVIEYPDASAENKVGQAWSLGDNDEWQWTTSPQPDGPNDFPSVPSVVELVAPSTSATSLKPCAPDQVRNPSTNRCRKISSATKTLTLCKLGQTRNPVTHRCRTAKNATKSLTPCKLGQTRNSATNRCRSVLAATKVKKPCKAGQERNPDTGRCRKIQPKISNIHDIKTASKSTDQHWYIVAALTAGAAGYISYEWRQEFSVGLERLKSKLKLSSGQRVQNLLK